MGAIIEKKHYVYSNGCRELAEVSTRDHATGFTKTHKILRNIAGPIPPQDLYKIFGGSHPIHPEDSNWLTLTKLRLKVLGFNTEDIRGNVPWVQKESSPLDAIKAFLTKYRVVEIAIKIAVIIGGVGIAGFSFKKAFEISNQFNELYLAYRSLSNSGVYAFERAELLKKMDALYDLSGLYGTIGILVSCFLILYFCAEKEPEIESDPYEEELRKLLPNMQLFDIPDQFKNDREITKQGFFCTFKSEESFNHVLVSTGQKYDFENIKKWILNKIDAKQVPTCPNTNLKLEPVNVFGTESSEHFDDKMGEFVLTQGVNSIVDAFVRTDRESEDFVLFRLLCLNTYSYLAPLPMLKPVTEASVRKS